MAPVLMRHLHPKNERACVDGSGSPLPHLSRYTTTATCWYQSLVSANRATRSVRGSHCVWRSPGMAGLASLDSQVDGIGGVPRQAP